MLGSPWRVQHRKNASWPPFFVRNGQQLPGFRGRNSVGAIGSRSGILRTSSMSNPDFAVERERVRRQAARVGHVERSRESGRNAACPPGERELQVARAALQVLREQHPQDTVRNLVRRLQMRLGKPVRAGPFFRESRDRNARLTAAERPSRTAHTSTPGSPSGESMEIIGSLGWARSSLADPLFPRDQRRPIGTPKITERKGRKLL